MILEALTKAKAFADLSGWRKISVTGVDAVRWLNGLTTTDLNHLRPGSSQRALLLDAAGGLLADVTIAVPGSSVLIVQDPVQSTNVVDVLALEVGDADVELEDRSTRIGLFAFPTRPAAPDLGGTAFYSPSALGPGADITCLPEDHPRFVASLSKPFTLATPDDLEAWRIDNGWSRLGVDAFEGDLPAEAGLGAYVDAAKGPFPGREPALAAGPGGPLRTVVLALETAEPVSPGEDLLVAGQPAGKLTSVTATLDGVAGLARVAWELRAGPFETADGVALGLRGA